MVRNWIVDFRIIETSKWLEFRLLYSMVWSKEEISNVSSPAFNKILGIEKLFSMCWVELGFSAHTYACLGLVIEWTCWMVQVEEIETESIIYTAVVKMKMEYQGKVHTWITEMRLPTRSWVWVEGFQEKEISDTRIVMESIVHVGGRVCSNFVY